MISKPIKPPRESQRWDREAGVGLGTGLVAFFLLICPIVQQAAEDSMNYGSFAFVFYAKSLRAELASCMIGVAVTELRA